VELMWTELYWGSCWAREFQYCLQH